MTTEQALPAEATTDARETLQAEPPLAFVIEQYKQSAEGYRAAIISVISFSTVLVVVNASLVGYAVGQEIAGLMLAGPLFPIAMIAGVLVVQRIATPLVYVCLLIEHRYSDSMSDWLTTTFVSVLNRKYVERSWDIGAMSDPVERMKAVSRLRMPIIGTGRGIFRGLLALVAIGQPIAAVVLWHFYDWRFF